MTLPTRIEAQELLNKHTKDEYLKYHAMMVAVAVEGYAEIYGEDLDLWYITGLLHDLDYEEYPDTHPAESLKWFREWHYPEDLIHAVEAHAYGYNGNTTLPKTKLASTLFACDEICGIFYAYKKMNPVPYSQMKISSIKKKFSEKSFAAKIDRSTTIKGCEALGIELDKHIENLVSFFAKLDN
jgi:putative nucleotidyltransferase with HDIG domain